MESLTERQLREIAYHSGRATLVRQARKPIAYDILKNPRRRWWNHYWWAYRLLLKADVVDKVVLVPGCGEGVDAIRMSKAGAHAHAFDISPDMVRVAEERAAEEAAPVEVRQMAAERLTYGNDTFDAIFLHDVLHHCELDKCLEELVRVAKRDAFVVIDELYTHDILQRTRESNLGWWLHSKVTPYIYPTGDAYITEDERKLTNRDLRAIKRTMCDVQCDYFNIVVGRFVPEWTALAIGDRSFLKLIGPVGYLFAGRFVLSGRIKKAGNCG